jgi:hypothetical protein
VLELSDRPECWPALSLEYWKGQLCHAPHVESDCRKGPPETDTPNEPPVECSLVCERPGTDHLAKSPTPNGRLKSGLTS